MTEYTRRDALTGATALGALVLAGCVADDGGESTGSSDGGDQGDDEGPSGETETSAGGPGESDGVTGNGVDSQAESGDESDDGDEERVERGADEGGEGGVNGRADGDEDDERGDEDGDGGNEDDERGDEDDRDRRGPVDGQEVVLGHTVETTDSGCTTKSIGTARKRGVTRTDGGVTVEGSLVTSTPCYAAVVESVSYDSGDLTLAVSAEPEPGVCIECIGEITYEATVSLSEGVTVDTVSVAHLETEHRVDGGRPSGGSEP
jgi:hypothetical protein